jgi:hypothetical protein
MRAPTVTLTLIALAFAASAAEPLWKSELRQNRVERQGDKLVIDEYNLCTVTPRAGGEGMRIQARSYAEAPASLVSRDMFVTWVATLEAGVSAEYGRQGRTLNCKVIQKPIGEVDLETKLIMTDEGFQWEVANRRDGTTTRTTRSWDEVYPATVP